MSKVEIFWYTKCHSFFYSMQSFLGGLLFFSVSQTLLCAKEPIYIAVTTWKGPYYYGVASILLLAFGSATQHQKKLNLLIFFSFSFYSSPIQRDWDFFVTLRCTAQSAWLLNLQAFSRGGTVIENHQKCLIFHFCKRTKILAILGTKIQIFEGTIIILASKFE